jgi:eukaryotic-like serine/threonine-protein kinase
MRYQTHVTKVRRWREGVSRFVGVFHTSVYSARVPTCTQCRTEIPASARVCPRCHTLQRVEASAILAPGATIDRPNSKIVVDAKIGEGGMGIVFRGWRFYPPGDERAAGGPRLVALKALRAHRASDPRLREYFMREAEALRALSHPNVVQFDELFEHGAGSVLAMEFIDGEPLDAIVKRHRLRAAAGTIPCMPALRALAYFEQLLGALAALHALGIVHRDVKPQNVLVRRDGIVKLTDFGIAKHSFGESAHAPMSDAGVAPGTGKYMSPEQVMGAQLDGRSDLYSAAIVLFEMLAGRPPFGGRTKSEIEIRQEQVAARPPSVRSFFAQLPPALDAFFDRAFAKEPRARFADPITMGTAARGVFGLEESEEWRALCEIVLHAQGGEAPDTERMDSLRGIVLERYCTAPMPMRKPTSGV